ncbi:MAG: hypothetical protein H6Q71_2620 [Firmicutes bacterium]|nr:hypothetical protein [Bacillota bacterium]
MVTKIMPIYRLEFANRDHRSATDGAKKKLGQKATFKEVFARELAGTAKR